MTRRTREQVERLEAISYGINRVSRGFNWTLVIVAGGMSAGLGGVGYFVAGTERAAIGGAGLGLIIGVLLVAFITWELAHTAIEQEKARGPAGGVDIGEPVRTGDRQWRVPVQPPFEDVRRLTTCRRWLRDVHYGDATLSQDGTETQRGGCEYGLTRREVSHVKEWAIDTAGWYYWINEGNATGDWTSRGRAAVAALATAETGDVQDAWEAALVVREAPTPAGDESSPSPD